MTLPERIHEAFSARYGEAPAGTVRVPASVNLIGGHTSYNGGYVLACAVDRSTWVAYRPRTDSRVCLYSPEHEESIEFDLSAPTPTLNHWGDAVKIVVAAFHDLERPLVGWEGVIVSDIPRGLDMGEVSALMMATLRIFTQLNGHDWEPIPLIRVTARTAHAWTRDGRYLAELLLMALAQPSHAILIDIQGRTIQQIAWPSGAGIVMLDSGVRFKLEEMQSLMQTRQEEIARVVKTYRVTHLRDLSMSRFEKDSKELEDRLFNRARHVMTENGRTILAAEMLRSEALVTVGKLMMDSHRSLREEYGFTAEPLEALFTATIAQANVYGARMGGMGGGIVALTRDFSSLTAGKLASNAYQQETGQAAPLYVLKPIGAVELL
ncbi:MAG: galactokinase [Phototrophicaceae bacterium]